VRRNRCRRRLRAIATEVADRFPPGSYLIGLGPEAATMSFAELRRRVIEALEGATKAMR
jgi:RNase P protein component